MKKMTCRKMGGVCDHEMSAETPDEMKDMGTQHVQSMDDDAHKELWEGMQQSMQNPAAMEEWQKMFMEKWENAAEA